NDETIFVITQHMIIIIIMGVQACRSWPRAVVGSPSSGRAGLPQLASCRCWLAAVRACRLAAVGPVLLLARRRPGAQACRSWPSAVVGSPPPYIYIYIY
ncbi:MAG: hypothetical protein ACKPKO_08450, partial [Candidatus Fonsibacter sp.]